jgi:hypothetical protein
MLTEIPAQLVPGAVPSPDNEPQLCTMRHASTPQHSSSRQAQARSARHDQQ